MSYLYLDTTHILRTGLLSKKFEWLGFFENEKLKASSRIHGEIFEILRSNGLDIKEIERIIYIAGPGSYTGMRLSEGMAQIFKWQGIETNSLYHFEIPLLMNIKKGYWFSEAFKGEYFCYSWDGEQNQNKLIDRESFLDLLKSIDIKECYSNNATGLKVDYVFNSTNDLIINAPEQILKRVVDEKWNRSVMYYRTEEKEFNVQKT